MLPIELTESEWIENSPKKSHVNQLNCYYHLLLFFEFNINLFAFIPSILHIMVLIFAKEVSEKKNRKSNLSKNKVSFQSFDQFTNIWKVTSSLEHFFILRHQIMRLLFHFIWIISCNSTTYSINHNYTAFPVFRNDFNWNLFA